MPTPIWSWCVELAKIGWGRSRPPPFPGGRPSLFFRQRRAIPSVQIYSSNTTVQSQCTSLPIERMEGCHGLPLSKADPSTSVLPSPQVNGSHDMISPAMSMSTIRPELAGATKKKPPRPCSMLVVEDHRSGNESKVCFGAVWCLEVVGTSSK